MRVRIVRKFAQCIDGIDLSNHEVGDVIDLPPAKARMLVAEGWAIDERRLRLAGPSEVIAFRRVGDLGHLLRDEDDVSQAS